MEPTNVQIWRHIRSGEQYVVEMDFSGTVVDAAGPLHHREIEMARGGDFTSDSDLARDIDEDQESYAIVEPERTA
jgi:hypothetical protein